MVIGNFTWLMLTPLLVFIGGGAWLINKFDWNIRWILLFVILGLVFAGVSVWEYAKKFMTMYDDNKKAPTKRDKEDYDY